MTKRCENIRTLDKVRAGGLREHWGNNQTSTVFCKDRLITESEQFANLFEARCIEVCRNVQKL